MFRLRDPYEPPIVGGPSDLPEVAPETLDAILAREPTAEEVEVIHGDFDVTFESDPDPISRRSLIDAFRCLRALRFDAPVPMLGSRSAYAWLRSGGIAVHVFDGDGFSRSGRPILIRRGSLLRGSAQWDDGAGVGMVGLVELLVHEGFHTISGVAHDCRDAYGNLGLDSSLGYGGAWAAQYWFDRWLAEHSGSYLSDAQKRSAANLAEELRTDGSLSCGVQLQAAPGFHEPTHTLLDPEVRRCLKRTSCPRLPPIQYA